MHHYKQFAGILCLAALLLLASCGQKNNPEQTETSRETDTAITESVAGDTTMPAEHSTHASETVQPEVTTEAPGTSTDDKNTTDQLPMEDETSVTSKEEESTTSTGNKPIELPFVPAG